MLDELTNSMFHDLSLHWRTSILYKECPKINQDFRFLGRLLLEEQEVCITTFGHVNNTYSMSWIRNDNFCQPLVPANTPWATIWQQKKSNCLFLMQPNKAYVSQAFCREYWSCVKSGVRQCAAVYEGLFSLSSNCRFFSLLFDLLKCWRKIVKNIHRCFAKPRLTSLKVLLSPDQQSTIWTCSYDCIEDSRNHQIQISFFSYSISILTFHQCYAKNCRTVESK